MLPALRAHAYDDAAFSLGRPGATISQPYIVALMTQLLDPGPSHRVLEIGSGSGYQTAVLARLVAEVCAVERDPELVGRARTALEAWDAAAAARVRMRAGDGHQGWPEHAPYDRILAACAVTSIPAAWAEQARPGAVLVAPLDRFAGSQDLVRATLAPDGRWRIASRLPVAFVPMRAGAEETR